MGLRLVLGVVALEADAPTGEHSEMMNVVPFTGVAGVQRARVPVGFAS
jgi:hypothetical protein